MTKRPYGLGTVEPYRDKFRARAPRDIHGKRPVLGIRDTAEAANQLLEDVAVLKAEAGLGAGGSMTLRGYGSRFLDTRELGGVRDIGNERSRWKNHIATAHFADWPMRNVDDQDIRDWLLRLTHTAAADVRVKDPKVRATRTYNRRPRMIGPQTRRHAFNLMSQAFDAAKKDKLVERNPCDDVDAPIVPTPAFDYLHLEEQQKVERATKVDEADRLRAMFAWGCGIRQYDQWVMKLADLRLDLADPDMIILCHKNGPRKPPRRIRVQLFGIALRALKRWLELLPSYCPKNERGLVWPLPSGAQRQRCKSYGWSNVLKASGITRNVTWHELRDTCASSLLMGWWGRKWTMAEVAGQLCQSDIETTVRYAHMADSALAQAARETIGHPLASTPERGRTKSQRIPRRATLDSNQWPSAPEAHDKSSEIESVDHQNGQAVANPGGGEEPAKTALWQALAEAIAGGRAAEAMELAGALAGDSVDTRMPTALATGRRAAARDQSSPRGRKVVL